MRVSCLCIFGSVNVIFVSKHGCYDMLISIFSSGLSQVHGGIGDYYHY